MRAGRSRSVVRTAPHLCPTLTDGMTLTDSEAPLSRSGIWLTRILLLLILLAVAAAVWVFVIRP